MATQTGGYPSLTSILQTMQLYLNDWQAGATQTPGEGRITTASPTQSPQTLRAIVSAVREVYRELRNVGDPTLLRDNILVNLPANAVTGPNVQTYLGFSGYFDGSVVQPTIVLPPDLIYPLALAEQQTGTGLPFVPMFQPPSGLSPVIQQTVCLGQWEWRGGGQVGATAATAGGDALWFVGSIAPVTIRIRYLAALTQFISPVNYDTTFVPIMDCEEAVAAKAAFKIARALSGITPAVSDIKADAQLRSFLQASKGNEFNQGAPL